MVFARIQAEASRYPGASLVGTPYGGIWMTPIEATLYGALLRENLTPVPQFCIDGFFVDFAFPALGIAVEADGSVHSDPRNLTRDHWRDRILQRSGWTVMRFHGTTIVHKSENCAYVVRRAIQQREDHFRDVARQEEARRRARAELLRHPLRALAAFLRGGRQRTAPVVEPTHRDGELGTRSSEAANPPPGAIEP